MFGIKKNMNSAEKKLQKYIDAYMKVAYIFADMSHCKRRKVGSIIVKDGRIISMGWNGTPTGFPNKCEINGKTKIEVMHAEANSLMKLVKNNESGKNALMFITTEPCIECAKLIVQSGIDTVHYAEDYPNCSRGLGKDFLKRCGIQIIKVNT